MKNVFLCSLGSTVLATILLAAAVVEAQYGYAKVGTINCTSFRYIFKIQSPISLLFPVLR